MPRKSRKKPVETVEQFEQAAATLTPMSSEEIRQPDDATPNEIRQISDEPDVFDQAIAAQAKPEAPQQPDHSRKWTGRALIGHHTPSRGTVRVIDDGSMVGVQLDEPPSPEELRILREPAENGQRGLTWNSVRGTNLKPTNGNPIAARLDCEKRAEAVARGRGWQSAVDQSRSDEGPSR